MSFRILSAILRQTWAIDERYALAHGWLVSNILQGLGFIQNPSAQLRPQKIQTGSSPSGEDYVSIIPIHGVMMKYDQEDLCDMAAGTLTMGRWIREAAADPEVKAIILDVDTPGGTADGTELLAEIISKVSKPVIAHSNGLIASAGYWVASAADEIWASGATIEIGSIGVQLSFADMRPMWEKEGVKFHIIRADQSKDKNEEFIQALEGKYDLIKKESLNPLAAIFIDAVKANRNQKLTNPDEVTSGKVFFASDALQQGLIDKIGSIEDAIAHALDLAHKKQQLKNTKQSETMEKYPQISKISGTELEASDEGLFLSTEIAQAIDQALADAETSKADHDGAIKATHTRLEDQALAAQQATSELETANKTIAGLNNRISELEKEAITNGGGATTNEDRFDGQEEQPSDPEAKALYEIRKRNFGQ